VDTVGLVFLAIFIAAGVNSYLHLPVEAYPDVTNVSVQIITLFPGHAAEEVERFITTLRAAPGFPEMEIKALEDWVVEKKFRSVPGVVDVNPFGGLSKQYQVLVDPAKLKAYNLFLQQVFTALANGNSNAGGSGPPPGSGPDRARGK
jgi:Cu/Ag efflux pump CusA